MDRSPPYPVPKELTERRRQGKVRLLDDAVMDPAPLTATPGTRAMVILIRRDQHGRI